MPTWILIGVPVVCLLAMAVVVVVALCRAAADGDRALNQAINELDRRPSLGTQEGTTPAKPGAGDHPPSAPGERGDTLDALRQWDIEAELAGMTWDAPRAGKRATP